MEEKLVTILNEMAEYLSIAQMKGLQEVLLKNLSEAETPKVEFPMQSICKWFLDAKENRGLFGTNAAILLNTSE